MTAAQPFCPRLPQNGHVDPSFTIDTHLFVELGELLVARDATALAELVKNSYDADATLVHIEAEGIDAAGQGSIWVKDNGAGMTPEEFRDGFLRIAGRTKRVEPRRSKRFNRRFTGEKGVGRLAAQKLAHELRVTTVARAGVNGKSLDQLEASIDWDAIDSLETLQQVSSSGAIKLLAGPAESSAETGTVIELRKVRHAWTAQDRAAFIAEVEAIEAPRVLREGLSRSVVHSKLLFDSALVRDSRKGDSGLKVTFGGDLVEVEDYWQRLAQSATWVVEIEAKKGVRDVHVAIAPTLAGIEEHPHVTGSNHEFPHPNPSIGPFFQARILCREGQWPRPIKSVDALRQAVGIRVFLEGFRVPPYGAPGNDWLGLDADYTARGRVLRGLGTLRDLPPSKDEGLITLPNNAYYGGVFLTADGAPYLRTLVNREGFVADPSFPDLVQMVRVGIDILTRTRARYSLKEREERRRKRSSPSDVGLGAALSDSLGRATSLARDARSHLSQGDVAAASTSLRAATAEIDMVSKLSRELISQANIVRVLASVGTQMAAFIHETNGLLHTASTVEDVLLRLQDREGLDSRTRSDLASAARSTVELRERLEREASYLVDVVGADARRRRMRLSFSNRFDAAARFFGGYVNSHKIEIENAIPESIVSPLMFPAELTTVFSNLLSNAVKASEDGGRIRASGHTATDQSVIRIENSGREVDLGSSEEWFEPYASDSTSLDSTLGQGMGLGLTITRAILAEYGATVRFTKPESGFATAVELYFKQSAQ